MPNRSRVSVVVALGLAAVLLAWVAAQVPGTAPGTAAPVVGSSDASAVASSSSDDGGAATGDAHEPVAHEPPDPIADPPAVRDVAANTARVAPGGEIVAAPEREDYECLTPRIEIPREPGCDTGAAYPACRWQVPGARGAGDFFRIWRNTTPEHRWGQPGLTSLVLGAAREYAARWPGEIMTIGDLDAAGVRHQTHDAGHDVDLYLEHAMIDTNIGGGHQIPTYAGVPARIVRLLRAQVMDLARILATCAHGRVRIYYNDPELIPPFLAWFAEHGMVSDVGPAMLEHNRLHRFHFHVTIADGMDPLPLERPAPDTGPE